MSVRSDNKKRIFVKHKVEIPQAPLSGEVRRNSYIDPYKWIIEQEIAKRNKIKLIIDDNDLTPNLLDPLSVEEVPGQALRKDPWKVMAYKLDLSLSKTRDYKPADSIRKSIGHTMKTSMDDITKMSVNIVSLDDLPYWRKPPSSNDLSDDTIKIEKVLPQHIKITLKETDDILLYQKASVTEPKDSIEAKDIEIDNKTYDFLTIGKGKIRRKTDAEAQTVNILYKSRDANTITIPKVNIGSYVSNFEMFDTYKDLEKSTTTIDLDGQQKLDITTYKIGGIDQFEEISKSDNYELACMLTQRVLAGNIFETEQRRFRNMILPDPLSLDIKYEYNLNDLWRFTLPNEKRRNAVVLLRFCPNNGDILAVAYGVYKFIPVKQKLKGFVCIWSIKNPINPERRYDYPVPVVSIEFSPFLPQLLAIGLYDGNVEVRDISNLSGPPVAMSQRSTSPGYSPIKQIRWINLGAGEDMDYEPFLVISEDGTVTKYRITSSPYLIGYQQMLLDRVEGNPEGLVVSQRENKLVLANRHPQGLGLEVHPIKNDVYFVLTDEGCIHKCSLNYTHQHIELMKAHDGCIFGMQFSPWSPKLFLTCGADWCIRIWIEGIVEPLIKLSNGVGPVHCASWSTTHSTVIFGITRSDIEVWDIRRSILKPVKIKDGGKSNLTISILSNCGRSIVVGNEKGEVLLCAIEDMPFPPFFQYRELEAAIFKAIIPFPDLTNEVKSLGFWGYDNKL